MKYIKYQGNSEKLKTNFEDKTSFIIKMSTSELAKSASEDKNYRTEESETSEDECFPDLTKPQRYMYESCISKEFLKKSCLGKESSDSEEEISKIGNTLLCYWGKCNQWLFMQKAFTVLINKEF